MIIIWNTVDSTPHYLLHLWSIVTFMTSTLLLYIRNNSHQTLVPYLPLTSKSGKLSQPWFKRLINYLIKSIQISDEPGSPREINRRPCIQLEGRDLTNCANYVDACAFTDNDKFLDCSSNKSFFSLTLEIIDF